MKFNEAAHYRALLLTHADKIMARKSREYAAPSDIFTNLKACEVFGVMSAELGVWVRLTDKVARLGNLLKNEHNPEAVFDTVIDLINYATHIYLLLIEKDPAYACLLKEEEALPNISRGESRERCPTS
jgi:hypothetical protein